MKQEIQRFCCRMSECACSDVQTESNSPLACGINLLLGVVVQAWSPATGDRMAAATRVCSWRSKGLL